MNKRKDFPQANKVVSIVIGTAAAVCAVTGLFTDSVSASPEVETTTEQVETAETFSNELLEAVSAQVSTVIESTAEEVPIGPGYVTVESTTAPVAIGPGVEKVTEPETAPEETEAIATVESVRAYNHFKTVDGGTTVMMPIEHQDYMYKMCEQYGIKDYHKLALAMSFHESTYRANVISRTNDYGYMQINRGNHSRLRKKLGVSNFLDPYQNIQCGVYMLSEALNQTGFDISKALVYYNTGKKNKSSSSYSRCVINDMNNKMVIVD